MRKIFIFWAFIAFSGVFYSCKDNHRGVLGGAVLSDLIKPMDGKSMRSTSTELNEEGKPFPHNFDNSRVKPGESRVVLDAQGPGVVTHMWFLPKIGRASCRERV